MEYTQFLEHIRIGLELKIPEEYHIIIQHVVKNNSIEMDGISILKEGEHISPMIYLNSFYEQYKKGRKLEEILSEIFCILEGQKIMEDKFNLLEEMEFDFVKGRVVYRLVNYEKNESLLNMTPHLRFLDLAIIFHCLLQQNKDGIGSVRITNDLMGRWGCTTKELFQMANQNTRRYFPEKLCEMEDVIKEMMRSEFMSLDIGGSLSKQQAEELETLILQKADMESEKENEMPALYVITNEHGINGASVLLYTDLVKNLSMSLESDLYILPSSIHEILIIPYSDQIKKEKLISMVQEVNQTQVAKEDFLSDNVYIYNRETQSINY